MPGPATVLPMPKGKSKDVLGRVYEYFLGKSASAEGTLQSAKSNRSNRRMNRVFSLSASTGERVGVRCRNPKINRRAIESVRGQRWPRASTTTWKLARMNLAIRNFSLSASNGERAGARCRIQRNADSFRADLPSDLKADFVPVRKDLANPPFNMSDWGGENLRQDVRWKFGMPPESTQQKTG